MNHRKRFLLAGAITAALGGCSFVDSLGFVPSTKNFDIVKGPAIEDVDSPFDAALSCVRGKIEPSISFAVGNVIDATGKESYADGGSGKMLSQGAGEMVQTALFRAGVTVVNRRDPNIPVVETQWGIRDIKQLTPANFYVSGSINSLDFIPGGGIELDVAGMGAGRRQNRILIALDLSLTDAFSGRIVANVPLQKQIMVRETKVGTDRFFDSTLISLSAGGMEREAVHFAMRQMLNFATLELLGQLMPDARYLPCKAMVAPVDAYAAARPKSGDLGRLLDDAVRRNAAQPLEAIQGSTPAQAPQQAKPVVITPAMRKQMELATGFAGRALVSAQASRTATANLDQARSYAKESQQYLAASIQGLRAAVAEGLSGPEGDAVALLVEQAIKEVQSANQALMKREADLAQVQSDAATAQSQQAGAANAKATAAPKEGSRDSIIKPGVPN